MGKRQSSAVGFKRRVFALLFTLASVSLSAAPDELPFAIGEWPPLIGESLTDYGYAAQIVRAACEAAGLKPRFDFYPWPRAELYAAEGRVFATFPFLRIPEREDYFFFSDPILHSSIGILRLASSEKTKAFKFGGKPEEFAPYIVGTLAGTLAVIEPLRKVGVTVETTPELGQSVQKLEKGRVDFVMDERSVIGAAVSRLYPGKPDLFVFTERDFIENRGYLLLVSKRYPDSRTLLDRFNAGLAKIRSNGTLDRIRAKNGL